ncbi:MAG TPA: DsrE family protein [Telluria sp.]|nr:DsrE family protein [Telluria sp.]
MKRILTAILLPLLMILGVAQAQTQPAREERVVYHFNDSTNAMAGLRNIRNHLEASPKAKIVVVAHGPGIDFLLDGAKDKNGNPYELIVQELAAKKVQFRVCNNTLMSRNIPREKVMAEASIVPSGVAEIARLQAQEGFVYIKP